MKGFRLSRRKKLVPGVTLNLSRSGPSVRLGVRGAGVTVGGRYGLRTTVGVPGTGVYYTKVAQRHRGSSPPLHASYTQTRSTSRQGSGWLGAIIWILLATAVVSTAGLALIPIIWYKRTRPSFKAKRVIDQAQRVTGDQAVALLHAALDIDPQGLATTRYCGDWFFAQHCWQDACDAYGDYLHLANDWDVESAHLKSLLGAGHFDEAIARLDQLRTMPWLNDESRAMLISGLALAWMHKGDFQKARAVLDTAGLQKHNLGVGLQQCLAMRAGCSYFLGQQSKGVADLDRLYAVNPNYPNLVEMKAEITAGTFKLEEPKPFPDWYPAMASPSADAGQLSPDGQWRWDGTAWQPADAGTSELI